MTVNSVYDTHTTYHLSQLCLRLTVYDANIDRAMRDVGESLRERRAKLNKELNIHITTATHQDQSKDSGNTRSG